MQISVPNQHAKVIVDVAIQMEKAVNDMRSQFSKLNLGSDISRQFESAFKGMGSNLNKILDLGGKNSLSTSEIERLQSLQKTVDGQFGTLARRFEELGTKGETNLQKISPEFSKLIKFIKDTTSAAAIYGEKLAEIKKQQLTNDEELTKARQNYSNLKQELAEQRAELELYQKAQENSGSQTQSTLRALQDKKQATVQELQRNNELIQKYADLDEKLQKYGIDIREIAKLKLEDAAKKWKDAYTDFGNKLENIREKQKALRKEQTANPGQRTSLDTLKKQSDELVALQDKIAKILQRPESFNGENVDASLAYVKQTEAQQGLQQQSDEVTVALERQQQIMSNGDAAIAKQQEKVQDLESQFATAEGEITNFSKKQDDLQKKLNNLKQPDIDSLRQKFQDLVDIPLEEVPTDLVQIIEKQIELRDKAPEEFVQVVRNLGEAAKDQGSQSQGIDIVTQRLEKAHAATKETNEQLDLFKSRIKYFFSAYTAVQMFRRGVEQTFETVKELDASMTEIAVVTDFSVGDMWQQLPKYTEAANELGVSIKDMYDSTKLFYQTGLDSDSVWQLTTETMKMARIAGLDAEEATNRMTSQLRSFNMELDQTSAQNVADVYSKLAAMSASNVDELSNAMSKTASIAANAGSSFENTAAFLAQIIKNMVTCSSNAA